MILPKFYLTAFLILIGSGNLFSQQLIYPEKTEPSITEEHNFTFPKAPEIRHTKQGLEIINEMIRLKNDQGSNNGDKILDLQRKLESIEHISVTKNFDKGDIRFSDNTDQKSNPIQTDAITISEIYSTSNSNIKAIATQVEQRATGIGTIWVATAVGRLDSGISATADTILLFKSLNNGLTYSLYSRIAANPGNKVSNDELDMEIIEPNSSQKYIYLTIGFTTNGYTGIYRSSIMVYDILNNVSAGQTLNFPGTIASSKFYRPRITSDNAKSPDQTYVTISVIEDSTDGINHHYMTKFCRILNPYSISPAITYLPAALYLPLIYAPFSSTVHADIANYNNGGGANGDSLIFVLSGFPGAPHNIFIYKGYSNIIVQPILQNVLSGNFNEKQFARIASTGGSNQLKMMIVFNESQGSPNSTLYAYKTTDAVNWNKSEILGGAFFIFQFKNPDVIGQRNIPGKFYIAYKVESPMLDIVGSGGYNDLTRTSFVYNHNNIGGKSNASPKPAFRYNNTDSCLTVWSNSSSLYSSCGCNAINLIARFNIQALYDAATNNTKYDLVTLYLRNNTAPYAKVDSAKGYSGTLYTFLNAPLGNYYISLTNRNTIETWYYQPVPLGYSGNTVDMTSILSRAYGSNQIQIDNSPVKFGLYSGDINQDGTIDAGDLSGVENDAANSVSGYVSTDLNGDDFVDGSDLSIVENNVALGVSVITP